MQITGKVVHVDLSGGFWGIEGDNGRQYCPVNGLPERFRKAGTRVKAKASPADGLSIFMWGENVHIEHIEAD